MSRISETSLHTAVGLTVSELPAAVRFYSTLFNAAPLRQEGGFARFQADEPPLVLTLRTGCDHHAGSLNHIGFRLEDPEQLVTIQHRLESAGYSTEREEDVECCYSQQTKFWVTDPDGHLWEIYILEAEGEQQDDLPAPSSGTSYKSPAVWGHRKGEALSLPLAAADASLDEVHLDRSEPLESDAAMELLRETCRVLKTGGTLAINVVLPRVEKIPDLLALLTAAGFRGVRIERWQAESTAATGHLQLSAVKPRVDAVAAMYLGPACEVETDDGQILRRSVRASLTAGVYESAADVTVLS